MGEFTEGPDPDRVEEFEKFDFELEDQMSQDVSTFDDDNFSVDSEDPYSY